MSPIVILTTTNAAAKRINMAYLDALPGRPHRYDANITGEYCIERSPAETAPVLKPGAKVMMLSNDPDRRWVNGTVARVSRLNDKRSWSRSTGKEYEIEQVAWEHRRYAFDQSAEKIVENDRRHVQAIPTSPRLGADHS